MYSWQWRQNAGKDLWTNMQEVFAECKKTTPLIRYSNTSAPLTRAPPCIWMSFIFCLLYIYNSMIVHVNFTSKYIVKYPGLNTVANNRCLLFIYTNVLHYRPTITCIIYYPPILYNSRFMKHERQQNTILGFPGFISTTGLVVFWLCILALARLKKETDLELIFVKY